jgi:hypothetical protein
MAILLLWRFIQIFTSWLFDLRTATAFTFLFSADNPHDRENDRYGKSRQDKNIGQAQINNLPMRYTQKATSHAKPV